MLEKRDFGITKVDIFRNVGKNKILECRDARETRCCNIDVSDYDVRI